MIEEQLGKAKVIDEDPTQKYTSKIQKQLCKLRKVKKFRDKEYFEICPSDPIPPRLYGTVKARKPEKNYPMCTLVSTFGTSPYGISKYLVKVIQLTLNKSQHKIKNSVEFVNEAKTWKLCVSGSYFLYKNLIWKLCNSGPIGLPIMVVLSECYLHRRRKIYRFIFCS